jgi:serine/threonine protein kinase
MRQKSTDDIFCPHCGYDIHKVDHSPLALLPGMHLCNGQYLLGRVLGKPGGFGLTYLGWDEKLSIRIAIKEYLPREYAGRNRDRQTILAHSGQDREAFSFGLTQFLQEARTLARFNHPNVVRVRSFFEENGTAYLVMDYYEGMTLAEYQKQQGGRLPEKQALDIMMPILDGLREVHEEGFLHRDIKPQNIYLAKGRNGVSPILLDFGAARFAMGERSRSLSVVLTPGFAPFEQYHKKGNQGAWTDIYACAATLYHLVTGTVPPEATERMAVDELIPIQQLAPGLKQTLMQAIMAGLAQKPDSRPQTVRKFQDLLEVSNKKGSQSNEKEESKNKTQVSMSAPLPISSQGKANVLLSRIPKLVFDPLFGVLLILFGLTALIEEIGFIDGYELFFPVAVFALGIRLIYKKIKR